MPSTTPPVRAGWLPFQSDDVYDAFRVSWSQHVGTKLTCGLKNFWIRCGNLESSVFADDLARLSVASPIYVAGLARSGSTVLLETLAALPGVGAHRYRDFPYVFTPIWWNRFLDRARRKQSTPRPRVHADGLAVSPESPEALEESIWMGFFPDAHDTRSPHLLDGATQHLKFAQFYRNHIQKILRIRGGNRYLCKGNYHVSRLEYLLKLFPDAKFVIPIRRPREHIASLLKQHDLFTAGETKYPRSLAQMQACGHFEFGLDRRVINLGDQQAIDSIEQLWRDGQEVRGWARYWAYIYAFLDERLAANPALRQAAMVVRFEDLCAKPHETLTQLVQHCALSADEPLLNSLASRLHAPSYYQPQFSAAEEAAIEAETSHVARRFGYTSAQFAVRSAA